MQNDTEQEDLLNAAVTAILAGARHIRSEFELPFSELRPVYKNQEVGGSLQTQIDKNSERDILSVLLSSPFKGDSFVAEESGTLEGAGPRRWYIDGFDGTANLHVQLRESTCGLMVRQGDEIVLSAAVDPFEDLLYVGLRGRGAWVYNLAFEDRAFRIVSEPARLTVDRASDRPANGMFVLADASFKPHLAPRKTGFLLDVTAAAYQVRMIGSNIKQGLMLAHRRGHVSLTDRIGGFFDLTGYFIAREAGAFVGNLDGALPTPDDDVVVCAVNQNLFELALRAARRHYRGER